MKYTRKDYIQFLNKEISAQVKEFESVKNTKALTLKDNGSLFVGKFMKIDDAGIAVFKIRKSDRIPRRNTYWTAVYLINEMSGFKNWGTNSWGGLRANFQRDFSNDAYCVWVSRADDPNFCLVGMKDIPLEFAELLLQDSPIIAFGPNDPPLQYLYNLLDVVEKLCRPKQLLSWITTKGMISGFPLNWHLMRNLKKLCLRIGNRKMG